MREEMKTIKIMKMMKKMKMIYETNTRVDF